MTDEVITTKRGVYGRVQVTIPMPVKQSMLGWIKKSGLGKAEFLRLALMKGAAQLANELMAKKSDEGFYSNNECGTEGPA